ncbi:MAG: hypothetical protein U0Z26_08885 [Anaerolineales bacterium]
MKTLASACGMFIEMCQDAAEKTMRSGDFEVNFDKNPYFLAENQENQFEFQ